METETRLCSSLRPREVVTTEAAKRTQKSLLADLAKRLIILAMPESITLYRVFLAAPRMSQTNWSWWKGCSVIGTFSMGSSLQCAWNR